MTSQSEQCLGDQPVITHTSEWVDYVARSHLNLPTGLSDHRTAAQGLFRGPDPERNLMPITITMKIGHRMCLAANPIGLSKLDERRVVNRMPLRKPTDEVANEIPERLAVAHGA